jgi:hypothetical protein
MAKKKDDFAEDLEKLAKQLAVDLAQANVQPTDRMNGLKILTSYYAATRGKAKKGADDDDENNVASFADFGKRIAAASGG